MINRIYSSLQLGIIILKTLKAVVFQSSDKPFWEWTQLSIKELPNPESQEQQSYIAVPQTSAHQQF
ncbi:MAG: hypothetical protein AAF821_08760 [Cyanobacteria bacterium P01_D01_bin.156]